MSNFPLWRGAAVCREKKKRLQNSHFVRLPAPTADKSLSLSELSHVDDIGWPVRQRPKILTTSTNSDIFRWVSIQMPFHSH